MVARQFVFRWLSLLSMLLLLAGLAACTGRLASESDSSEVADAAQALKTASEAQGLEAHEGYFKLWDIEQCLESVKVLGGCDFNNPTAPYLFPVVPYWPEEHVDSGLAGAFGETEPGYGATHRLDPNEAIVILGIMPPEAAYFGMQSYLFTRKGEFQTDNVTYEYHSALGTRDLLFHQMPLSPERYGSWDSLTDATNNAVIERQSGGVWGQFRYLVVTANRQMETRVRQMLSELSVDEKDIFTQAMPSSVTIGLEEEADDFLTLIRYSMPADGGKAGTASDAWRHDPSLAVLRIRATGSDLPLERYPAWGVDSPETRTAESEAYLEADLASLVHAVGKAWGQPCQTEDCSDRAVTFVDAQGEPFNLLGPKCILIGMDCLGDTQDATYKFTLAPGLDDGEVYAIVGTLGTATGNATYVSLALNNTRLRLGAKNVNHEQLSGSVTPEFFPDVENGDKLYVHYFTRDCTGLEDLTHGHCTTVEDTQLVIPIGDRASFVEREYIKPGTQRGPDSALTLASVLLPLQRPVE